MEGQAGQVPVLLLFRESREFLVVGVYITDVRLPRPPIVDILYHMLSPNNVDISHSKPTVKPRHVHPSRSNCHWGNLLPALESLST